MLYDPKWEVQTKPVPSLEGLVAWLETKDPAGTYKWAGCEPCLIEQYCLSIGIPSSEVFRTQDDGRDIYTELSTRHGGFALKGDHTFGAALERARAALAIA